MIFITNPFFTRTWWQHKKRTDKNEMLTENKKDGEFFKQKLYTCYQ